MNKTLTWKSQFQFNDIEIRQREVQYQGYYQVHTVNLRYKRFSGEWGDWLVREQVNISPSAAVLLFDADLNKVVLVEQFRMGALDQRDTQSPWLLEVVAGYINEDETPEDAALREAKEEAHAQITELLPIQEIYTTPGGLSERTWIFCGLVDSSKMGGFGGADDEHEDIKIHVLDSDQAFSYLDNNLLTNASTIIALQWLKLNRDHLR